MIIPILIAGFVAYYLSGRNSPSEIASNKSNFELDYIYSDNGNRKAIKPAADAFNDMVDYLAKEFGIKIYATSGYRSQAEQQTIWANALKKYGNEKEARKYAAKPGGSQHERGLAIDVGGWSGKLSNSSENGYTIRQTTEFAYLSQVMGAFGFRFYDKSIEPWHIEYIGKA